MRPAAPSRRKQPVWGADAGAARAQTLGDGTFQRRTCTYLMSAWYSSFSRWFQASPSRGPARTCRPPRGKHHKCHPPAKENGLRTVSSGIFFTLESVPLSQVSMIAASQRQRVGDTPEAHGRKALPTSSSPARTGTALRPWACAAMCAGYQTEGTARKGSDRPCTHVRTCAYVVATSRHHSRRACTRAAPLFTAAATHRAASST